MGGIIREISHEDTPVGRKAKELHDTGVLFPDQFLLEIVKEKLVSLPNDQGIIFDGIPRRIGQAQFLVDYLKQQNRNRMVTLFLDLPREESLNRLLLRAETEGRKDDTREAIEFRLQQYEQDTIPVLDYLRQHSIFMTIDGTPSIGDVTHAINRALELE
jgi:adenylate kinase